MTTSAEATTHQWVREQVEVLVEEYLDSHPDVVSTYGGVVHEAAPLEARAPEADGPAVEVEETPPETPGSDAEAPTEPESKSESVETADEGKQVEVDDADDEGAIEAALAGAVADLTPEDLGIAALDDEGEAPPPEPEPVEDLGVDPALVSKMLEKGPTTLSESELELISDNITFVYE